jgi:hypothetical protein
VYKRQSTRSARAKQVHIDWAVLAFYEIHVDNDLILE